MELGMNYSTEHNTFWLNENEDYILLKDDIFDYSALEFEETYLEVKNMIQDAKDYIEKQQVYEIRLERLKELGFILNAIGDIVHLNLFSGISKESIYECNPLEFEKIITDAKLEIEKAKADAEEAEKQKAKDLQLAKEDAERLKKENKARIKTFAADKKLLIELIESLDFHNALPEMQNDLSEEMLNKLIIDLDELKKGWLNNINNI